MSRLHVYVTPHVHSRTIAPAFAHGAGGVLVGTDTASTGPIAVYGWLRGVLPHLRAAQAEGRDWYYIDNGYLRAGHYGGYYRVTRNAYQYQGRGLAAPDRFQRLGIEISPWRAGGQHVLVCPPGDIWAEFMGFNANDWLRSALATISQHTDRPVMVRDKCAPTSLADDLRDCWAVVTYMSNAAVHALLAGVPVFVTGPCAAARMGRSNLAQIESPIYPADRDQWAWSLAANQWTLDEFRAGLHKEPLGIK